MNSQINEGRLLEMTLRRLFFRFVIFLTALSPAFAQSPVNLENGFKPYGSHDGSNLDTVNLTNGNWMLHAALVPEILQRGASATGYALYASSKNWQVSCIPSQAPTGRTCFEDSPMGLDKWLTAMWQIVGKRLTKRN